MSESASTNSVQVQIDVVRYAHRTLPGVFYRCG